MNTYTRYCVDCGSQFTEEKPKTGRYPMKCVDCRKPRSTRSKTCKHCAGPFQTSSSGRVYCSPECVSAATKARALAKAKEAMAELKTCKACQQSMERKSFHADSRRLDGLYPYCKDCRRARTGSRKFQPTKWASRADQERHRVHTLKRENPDEANRKWRANHLWATYRITLDEYKAMLAEQGNACAICGTTEPASTSKTTISDYRFAVDHDHNCCPGRHSCGYCVRGLLCIKCNSAIGLFRDSAAMLERAVTYLQQYERVKPPLNLFA